MTKFLDNFWDTDFNSTNGYEVLNKRMKDGRETCKAIEELLKQRAKAEEIFGKTLQKIAKSATGKEEIGGLRKGWDDLVTQTEHMGNSHVTLATRMMEEAKKIEDFRESQKEKRKKPEENTKKTQAHKKEWYNKTVQSKKTYEGRCKDADQADENYMKQRLVVAQKDVDKLMQKKERCVAAAEQSDAQYQASVKSLDEARREWEKQMEEFCVLLQQMEEERIRFLRNSLWVHVNMISLHCVQDDQNCEETRKILEQCSEENDIKLFVAQKRTGSSRPTPIEYENYRNNQMQKGSPIQNGRAPQTPPSEGPTRRHPHMALPSIPSNTARPVVNGRQTLPRQSSDTDPLYAAVEPGESQSNSGTGQSHSGTSQTLVRANFAYKSQGPAELDLSPGQILRVLKHDDTTWWLAEFEGRQGHIPADFVEVITPEPVNEKTEVTII